MKLARLASIRLSNVDKKSNPEDVEALLCNYTDVYNNPRITDRLDFMEATATSEQVERLSLRRSDVIITKDTETPEDIAVPSLVDADIPGLVCGYHLALLRPSPTVDGGYLYWALASSHCRQQATAAATGITRFGLSRDDIASIDVPLPSIERQQRIAAHLDQATARIDNLIAAKRRMMELARESASVALAGVLARPGSRNDVEIRRVLRKVSRPADRTVGVVTAFRDGHVMSRARRREEGFTDSEALHGYQGVCRGDVVFHGLDAFAGAVGVSEDDGICSPVYHVCEALDGHAPTYVAQALRALALSGYLSLQAGNVRERAVDFRNWDTLARIRIPLRPLPEQLAIANAFLHRRDWAERLCGLLQHQVSLLDERRRALIEAAVTGTLDRTSPA